MAMGRCGSDRMWAIPHAHPIGDRCLHDCRQYGHGVGGAVGSFGNLLRFGTARCAELELHSVERKSEVLGVRRARPVLGQRLVT